MNRRRFLQTSSIGIALPALESIGFAAANAGEPPVRRFVAIGSQLGFHTPSFFPDEAGSDYTTPDLLSGVGGLRSKYTLFSGLDHRAPNGHAHWGNYLTGNHPRSVSVDQLIARRIGDRTRFACLELTCGSTTAKMSYTREGIALPQIGRPSVLFGKLFSSNSDKARMEYLLDSGGSVLDLATREAKSLQGKVNARDREKLDEYFTSLRELEKDLQKQRYWIEKPTPEVEFEPPKFDPVAADLSLECETLMYELMALALETDSTRVISFLLPGSGQVFTIDGERLSSGYHGLSHHGNDPAKIADYNRIGHAHIERFAAFLERIEASTEPDGQSILSSTAVLFGSGMGNANTHDNSRLPVLLAGGPFKHGAYHAIDRESDSSATPLLGDLFLTVLQSMGIEEDRFANASRNLNEHLL